MRKQVAKMDNNSYICAKTAMYGIEATLPRASGRQYLGSETTY
ncbi:hypothetical protein [Lysinibacillus sp. ZYM-1]|nr:hypothetical protein [Lysinibacillus sp. ZYM-1]